MIKIGWRYWLLSLALDSSQDCLLPRVNNFFILYNKSGSNKVKEKAERIHEILIQLEMKDYLYNTMWIYIVWKSLW